MFEAAATIIVVAAVYLLFSRLSKRNLRREREITALFESFRDKIEDSKKGREFGRTYQAYLWAAYRTNLDEQREALEQAADLLPSELQEKWQEAVVSKWEKLRSGWFDKISRFFE